LYAHLILGKSSFFAVGVWQLELAGIFEEEHPLKLLNWTTVVTGKEVQEGEDPDLYTMNEWINEEENNRRWYFLLRCNFCKIAIAGSPTKCLSCKEVLYCSAAHRVEDAPKHKRCCDFLCAILYD